MWKGSGLPTELQGIKVLGTPLGHPDFVAAHLDRVLSDHRTLLERIPAVQDGFWRLLHLTPPLSPKNGRFWHRFFVELFFFSFFFFFLRPGAPGLGGVSRAAAEAKTILSVFV